MKVNVISESQFLKEKLGGIHSSFVNHVSLLQKKHVDVLVNSVKKADIVHFHSYGPLAFLKLITTKEPKVIMTHNVPESFVGSVKGSKFFLKVITAYLRNFYNKTDLIIALNPKTKKDIEKMGVTSKSIVLSNHINEKMFKIDPKMREKGRKKYKFAPSEFVVLGVGKQIPRKGIVDFLLLAQKFPEIRFVWAGERDFKALSPESKQQKDLIQNLPSNVVFTGLVAYSEIAMLYNMADIFFFPSYQEIAPMVVIEAAACGLPLLLRDLPEYRELYQTGYIAGKNNDDFEKALKKLSQDKMYYKKQKIESAQLAKKFSSEIIGEKMLEYYSTLL